MGVSPRREGEGGAVRECGKERVSRIWRGWRKKKGYLWTRSWTQAKCHGDEDANAMRCKELIEEEWQDNKKEQT